MLKHLSKNSFFLNIFANLVFFALWFIKNTSHWKGINEEIIEKELENTEYSCSKEIWTRYSFEKKR